MLFPLNVKSLVINLKELEEKGSFMVLIYLFLYIVLPCLVLYLIVYTAAKKALFEFKEEEEKKEDERISHLIQLRDKDIIDNDELELMVEVINEQIKVDADKATYKKEKKLLQELLSKNIIDEKTYEHKKSRLKKSYKSKEEDLSLTLDDN